MVEIYEPSQAEASVLVTPDYIVHPTAILLFEVWNDDRPDVLGFFFSGKLAASDDHTLQLADQPIEVWMMGPGDADYRHINTLTTNAYGEFGQGVAVSVEGTYYVRVVYSGGQW